MDTALGNVETVDILAKNMVVTPAFQVKMVLLRLALG